MEMKENVAIEVNILLDDNRKEMSSPKKKQPISLIQKFEDIFVKKPVETKEPSEINDVPERMRWDNFAEYFLSIIGFVIDLGNVWRFPTVCYENGGGAFLIPFFICLFLIGMPCMYMELAIGQYFQLGNISIWAKFSPYLKGIGFAVILINVLMLSYYNTLQAYALYYLINSFRWTVPWSSCDQPWSTDSCHLSEINKSGKLILKFMKLLVNVRA